MTRHIYTDGQSLDVTEDQARALQMCGICEPHPGVGEDGIVQGDLKLHAHHQWHEVYSLLRDMDAA